MVRLVAKSKGVVQYQMIEDPEFIDVRSERWYLPYIATITTGMNTGLGLVPRLGLRALRGTSCMARERYVNGLVSSLT